TLLGQKREVFRIAVTVAGEGKHVCKSALAAALVSDDRDHVEVQRHLAIEPLSRELGIFCLANVDAGQISSFMTANLLELRGNPSDENSVFRLVDDLAETIEGGISLNPAILVSRLGVLVLQLPKLVIYVVRVAALDAGLSSPKPLLILFG